MNDSCIITRSKFYGEYNLSPVKNNLIDYAQLHWSDESQPYSPVFEDIFFNTDQGLKESQYVFFEGNNLSNRWLNHQQPCFCVAETGFGSGLNFFNTALQFLQFREQHQHSQLKKLHFISFERFPFRPEDIKRTLKQYTQFSSLIDELCELFPLPITGCHRLFLANGLITLDLWFGDVNRQLPKLASAQKPFINAWYLDGFNPSTNPDMWQQTLFEHMFRYCAQDATLATFTAAGFVRRALLAAGFNVSKRKGFGKKREMLIANIKDNNCSYNKDTSTAKEVAIVGGGIASLCTAIALAKRGDKVTLYCQDKNFGQGASGNQQGTLYPLLNAQHDELSELFANAFLYARHYYLRLNKQFPFAHQFDGLLQLAYNSSSHIKLDKLLKAQLPETLVQWVNKQKCNQLAGLDIDKPGLFYPLAGWLSPRQLIKSLTKQLEEFDNIKINYSSKVTSFDTADGKCFLQVTDTITQQTTQAIHQTLILTTAMDTLNFKQCRAVPLSAARGQVTHIQSNQQLEKLLRPICHEGYLTPALNNQHCMGASFKRHDLSLVFKESEQQENFKKLKKCINNQTWVEEIKLASSLDKEHAHVGIRCTTRDHFPYLGLLPDYDAIKDAYETSQPNSLNLELYKEHLPYLKNVYLFTGLGSRGLCSAPLLAEVLASQIHGESLPVSQKQLDKMFIARQWLTTIRKEKPLKA